MINLDTNKDIHYDIDCYTDSDYDCEQSGCNDEGICRCSVITGLNVSSGAASGLISLVKVATDLERALWGWYLRKYPLDVSDDLEWEAEGGYYGEELGQVTVTPSFLQKLENFDKAENMDKLQLCLNQEYGFISQAMLKRIPEGKLSYRLVSITEIDANTSQLEKTDISKLYYSSRTVKLTNAIFCYNNGDKYRLVDGFHRFKHWTEVTRHRSATIPVIILE